MSSAAPSKSNPEVQEELNVQEEIDILPDARVRDRNGLTDAPATPRDVFGSEL